MPKVVSVFLTQPWLITQGKILFENVLAQITSATAMDECLKPLFYYPFSHMLYSELQIGSMLVC